MRSTCHTCRHHSQGAGVHAIARTERAHLKVPDKEGRRDWCGVGAGLRGGSASRRVLEACAVAPVRPSRVVLFTIETRTKPVASERPMGGRRHVPPPQRVHSIRTAVTGCVRGGVCTEALWETSCGGGGGGRQAAPLPRPLFSTTVAGDRDRGWGPGQASHRCSDGSGEEGYAVEPPAPCDRRKLEGRNRRSRRQDWHTPWWGWGAAHRGGDDLPTGGQGPWIRDQFRLIHQKCQGHFSRKRFQSGTKVAVSGTSPRA